MTTRGALVLVVENEPVLCQVIRCILEKGEYRVITANDAARALEQVKAEKPSLVIIGNLHSRIERKALIDHIRRTPDCQMVFFVSNNDSHIIHQKSVVCADDMFIQKPASMKKILAVAGQALTHEKVAVRL